MSRKSELMKDILQGLGKFVVMFPTFFIRESMSYKDLRIGNHDPQKIYRAFRNMKNRKLIIFDGNEISFTNEGKKWFKSSYERYFKFATPSSDKKWRIIIFDIPREHNKSRDKLRNTMKRWGFFMLQRSVFVCPYTCEDEIAGLCRRLKISDYVDIILADSPGTREEEVKEYFNVT